MIVITNTFECNKNEAFPFYTRNIIQKWAEQI